VCLALVDGRYIKLTKKQLLMILKKMLMNGRLHKKIERDPHNPSMIKTIRGSGYKFTARVEYS